MKATLAGLRLSLRLRSVLGGVKAGTTMLDRPGREMKPVLPAMTALDCPAK